MRLRYTTGNSGVCVILQVTQESSSLVTFY